MWYICRHMWYIKLLGVFDYKVVKFHFWTPCKCVFSFHGAKNWPKLVIFFQNALLGDETCWTKGFLAIKTLKDFLDTLYFFEKILKKWKIFFDKSNWKLEQKHYFWLIITECAIYFKFPHFWDTLYKLKLKII